MTEQQAASVDWKALSADAGRKLGIGARLWFFAVGIIALFAPGMCLVVFMRIIAKVITQETEDPEQIALFVKVLGAE